MAGGALDGSSGLTKIWNSVIPAATYTVPGRVGMTNDWLR